MALIFVSRAKSFKCFSPLCLLHCKAILNQIILAFNLPYKLNNVYFSDTEYINFMRYAYIFSNYLKLTIRTSQLIRMRLLNTDYHGSINIFNFKITLVIKVKATYLTFAKSQQHHQLIRILFHSDILMTYLFKRSKR